MQEQNRTNTELSTSTEFDETTKKLIDEIYQQTAKNDRNSTSLANTLEANIDTVFNSGYKFIYELLQNADDAKATEVQFTLSDTNLIISHNGDEFTSEDVNKLCDNAKSDSYKSKQLDKTGYKGVGFKAVFCISKKVIIKSGSYCFRFDQPHWGNTERTKFPWPIIPIWTEFDTLGIQLPNNGNLQVHFVLCDIKIKEIRQEIDLILQSKEVLLFLRHLNKITYKTTIDSREIIIEKTPNKDFTCLKYSDSNQASATNVSHTTFWLIQSESIPVPSDVKIAIANLSAAQCPQKLKEAGSIELNFAACIEEIENSIYQLTAVEDSPIYCYLPTQTRAGLPYLINTHFLLNQDRSSLMSGIWNEFLLEKIAISQFNWLASLAKQQRWSTSILRLLAPPALASIDAALNESYQKGYKEGLRKIAFIPSVIPGQLLKAEETYIDQTLFFKNFSYYYDGELQDQQGRIRLVCYNLFSLEKLLEFKDVEFKAKTYGFNELIERIEGYLQARSLTVGDAIKLLEYFSKQSLSLEQLDLLREKAILLSRDENRSQPKVCYLYPGQKNLKVVEKWIEDFELTVIHPNLCNDKTIKEWLEKCLKVSSLNRLGIIRNTIIRWISSPENVKHNSQKFLRLIYSAHKDKKLTNYDYQKLQLFPVHYKEKFVPINTVYYKPSCIASNQHNIPNELLFKTEGYIELGDDTAFWDTLLSRLGAKTELGLIFHANISIPEVNKHFQSYPKLYSFNNFFEALCVSASELKSSNKTTPRPEGKLENFIICNFLDKLDDDIYYVSFWQAFKADWKHFEKACQYDKRLKKVNMPFEIPHYIVYFLQHNDCIRVKGVSERKKSTEVYSSTLLYEIKDIVGFPSDIVDIADIPVELTDEQAKLLGFKLKISFEDCLKLLGDVRCQIPKLLNLIYQQLLSYTPLDEKQTSELKKWLSTNNLLAVNNSQQKIQSLYYFDLPENTPKEDFWLHTVSLDSINIVRLVHLCGIRFASKQEVIKSNIKEDATLEQIITNTLNAILPIAFILEKRCNPNYTFEQVRQARRFCFGQLVLADTKTKLKAHFDNGTLYISSEYSWDDGFFRGYVAIILGKDGLNLSESTYKRFAEILMMNRTISNLDVDKILESPFISIGRTSYDSELKKFQEGRAFLDRSNESEISHPNTSPSTLSNSNLSLKNQPLVSVHPSVSNTASGRKSTTSTASMIENSANKPSSNQSNQTIKKPEETQLTNQIKDNSKDTTPLPAMEKTANKSIESESKVSSFIIDQSSGDESEKPEICFTLKHHLSTKKALRPPGNVIKNEHDKKLSANEQDFDANKKYIASAEQEKFNKDIGNKGEKIVYLKILDLLKEKMGKPIDDLPDGVKFKKNEIEVDLKWFNKNSDKIQENADIKESPVDLVISVNGKDRYFIEVKSTEDDRNPIFHLTSNEWQYMRTHREKSILVRAYNVKEVPRLEIFKDPFGMICKDLITFMTGGRFRFFCNPKDEADKAALEEHTLEGYEDKDINNCKIS